MYRREIVGPSTWQRACIGSCSQSVRNFIHLTENKLSIFQTDSFSRPGLGGGGDSYRAWHFGQPTKMDVTSGRNDGDSTGNIFFYILN